MYDIDPYYAEILNAFQCRYVIAEGELDDEAANFDSARFEQWIEPFRVADGEAAHALTEGLDPVEGWYYADYQFSIYHLDDDTFVVEEDKLDGGVWHLPAYPWPSFKTFQEAQDAELRS